MHNQEFDKVREFFVNQFEEENGYVPTETSFSDWLIFLFINSRKEFHFLRTQIEGHTSPRWGLIFAGAVATNIIILFLFFLLVCNI